MTDQSYFIKADYDGFGSKVFSNIYLKYDEVIQYSLINSSHFNTLRVHFKPLKNMVHRIICIENMSLSIWNNSSNLKKNVGSLISKQNQWI